MDQPSVTQLPIEIERRTAPVSYSLAQLTWHALKLGTIGFGGAVALVGYMYRDLVERRRWTWSRMRNAVLSIALCIASVSTGESAMAETITFDSDTVGASPRGWTTGVTGRGAHRWTVEADESAPSRSKVLKQSGRGDFPWCVKDMPSFADGRLEVKFKPVSGKDDQAGGLVWRWKDGDSYYVARANALENNVSLYYTQGGRRITIKYVDAPVAKGEWHTLGVEFAGTRLRVSLDGRTYIDMDDTHIAGPGRIGVWTKADSVTLFDDFIYEAK